MTNQNYSSYFKKHYKANFSVVDINNSKKWLYPQWNLINSKVKIDQDSKILEVGSGLGGFYSLLEMNGYGSNYSGLEIDAEASSFTNTFFNVKHFKNRNLEDYKTTDKYDLVFAFEVLEHLDQPLQSIAKIHSLLTKEGFFVGSSPYPYLKNVLADSTHKYVLHPSNWEKLFKMAGFSEVQTFPMSFIPLFWRLSKYLNVRLPFYLPINGFISTALIIAKK